MTRRTRTKTEEGGKCRVCSKRHEYSESLCYRMNEVKLRSKNRPRVRTIGEAYVDGRLRGDLAGTDMEEKLLRRQQEIALDSLLQLGDNGYKVPKNVSTFAAQGFVWNQIAVEKPWAVYVLTNGRRKRKRFNNLREAILFHKKIHEKYPASGIVSLCKGYELPQAWLTKKDKLPKKFKWCPHCAAFRVFKRVEPPEKIFAMVKVWSNEKNRYEYADRELWLTECQLCGHNSRSHVFRRANQPYEVRKVKPGVRRIKARGDTKKLRDSRQRTQSRRRG